MKRSLLLPIGTSTMVVPTTLLASKDLKRNQSTSTTKKPEILIPILTIAKNIKNQYLDVKCLKSYFPTVTWGGTSTSNLKVENINDFSSSSKSCLLIEYNKKTYKDDKWFGSFRLIWSVKDDTQGLITIINVRTDKKKVLGSSSAYIMKKEGNEDKWKVSYNKEKNEYKLVAAGLSRLIPQRSSSLQGSTNETDYWGFNPDLNKVCDTNDCQETKGEEIKNAYSWEFKTGESGSIGSWTPNIQNWLDWIFGWKILVNKTNNIKGSWQNKSWS